MVLTGNEINKLIKEKNLIENCNLENVNSASYDISISNSALEFVPSSSVVELSNVELINSLYKTIDISDGYILAPQQCALFTLNETINIPDNLCAHIRPRTSLSRLGLIINFQHINSGYSGKLNILINNVSPNSYRILPNMRIGQIVFETLTSNVTPDLLYYNEKTPVYHNETGNTGSKIYADFIGKVFRHYKGNYYYIEDITMHSETKEYMILYKTLYDHKDSRLWVRPAEMFFEEIDPNKSNNITGQKHRFELVKDLSKDFTIQN